MGFHSVCCPNRGVPSVVDPGSTITILCLLDFQKTADGPFANPLHIIPPCRGLKIPPQRNKRQKIKCSALIRDLQPRLLRGVRGGQPVWYSASCCASSGQPNQPFLPSPRMKAASSGSRWSGTGATEENIDQPPLSSGSRLVRRVCTVAQSIAWSSTLKPACGQLLRHHLRCRIEETSDRWHAAARCARRCSRRGPAWPSPDPACAACAPASMPASSISGLPDRRKPIAGEHVLRIAAHRRGHHLLLVDRRQHRAADRRIVGRRGNVIGRRKQICP